MTLVLGITGGMASGKTTATRMLKRPGISIFNADACAHHLMTHDAKCIAVIAQHFPRAHNNGRIERSALAQEIIRAPIALKTLENILHPRIRAREIKAINLAARNRQRMLVLDIPLLFETGAERLCDYVIAVDVSEKLQHIRAFKRAGMTQEKYLRLRARQLPAAQRNAYADYVITSNLGRANMRRQLELLLRKLSYA